MSATLITWGRFLDAQGNKITVPAPPTNPGAPWLWDFIAAQAKELSTRFDALQIPPASKCQGGAGAGCDGYGVFDLRDIGSKNQQGSIPTRYGTRESLLRMVAVAHACGMNVLGDVTLHQMYGENGGPGVFRYLGADGNTLNGRGATTPGWFRGSPVPPWCNEDAVPSVPNDFTFGGREKSYQNCDPYRVTINDATDYGDWFFRATGIDGSRFDDVKGTWAPFVAEFMQVKAMEKKPFYAEYFDNAYNSGGWATGYPMEGRSGIEDFDAHFAIQSACNGGDTWSLKDGGYFLYRPDLSWPFVENPDTDLSPGQQVIWSKLLGYAYLLTIPCRSALVYGKDYFGSDVWPGAYGLKPSLDTMLWVNRVLAFGAYSVPYCDGSAIVLQRNGDGGSIGSSPGLLTAISFDQGQGKTLTVPTSFWGGTHLHDFLGHHPDIWCDGQGNATFTIPPNAYGSGQNALMFSWAGAKGDVIRLASRETTQVFEGAEDLDIGPAPPGDVYMTVGRIWCAAGTELRLEGTLPSGSASLSIDDPDAVTVMSGAATSPAVRMAVQTSGWHTLGIAANGSAALPFSLSATYTAASTI